MSKDQIIILVIIVGCFVIIALLQRLMWRMRSDNGYNMGRNHMHDLGFDDKDIEQGQDDVDASLYIFRKKVDRDHKKEDE